VGLARAEQIEIGPVEDINGLGHMRAEPAIDAGQMPRANSL
jgi:hypothetical protein